MLTGKNKLGKFMGLFTGSLSITLVLLLSSCGSNQETDKQRGIEPLSKITSLDTDINYPAYAEGALFHPATDASVIGRVIRDITKSDSIIAVKSLKALFNYTPLEAVNLSKLNRKLYLINSNATPTDTAALAATTVPFELLEINNTGHYPMIEKPREFNRLLLKILQEIENRL